jgi:LacI family transcriptional regulator
VLPYLGVQKSSVKFALSGTPKTLVDMLNPSLSSVYQPGFEMGQKATQMLLESDPG